jgi:hypothetical protein
MCNAYNHRNYCRCGWGYSGILSYSSSYPSQELSDLRSFASLRYEFNRQAITKPNYKCKWCKEKVFFFQASNGGKVLFDSLGKPWPIHNCLGIQYKRRKAKLMIPDKEWLQLYNVAITPSADINTSIYVGLLSESANQQFEVSILLKFDDAILIRDLYLRKSNYLSSSDDIEILLILDDGRHFFSTCKVTQKKSYEMLDLSKKKPFTQQPKLL